MGENMYQYYTEYANKHTFYTSALEEFCFVSHLPCGILFINTADPSER